MSHSSIDPPLQCYRTAGYACGYLPGKTARSEVVAGNRALDASSYGALIRSGFRRSGPFVYRPNCFDCRQCVAVRVRTPSFTPDRSQKRAWRRHQGLLAIERDLAYSDEHFELYRRYQNVRHVGGGMDEDTPEQYESSLLRSPVQTKLVEFREQSVLRMVSIIDRLDDGMSSVYTFFDPELPRACLGSYNILWQIDHCKSQGLPYLYLGYWIENSPKMAYKIRFGALEGLIGGSWTQLDPAGGDLLRGSCIILP